MRNVLDRTPRHLRALPEGLTQTRYSRFLVAPENRVRTVYDRVKDESKRLSEGWNKTRFWESTDD